MHLNFLAAHSGILFENLLLTVTELLSGDIFYLLFHFYQAAIIASLLLETCTYRKLKLQILHLGHGKRTFEV